MLRRQQMKKAAKIVLSDGVPSLLFRIAKSVSFRVRHRVNSMLHPEQSAGEQIDRIATRNISNSEKFSLIYKKRLWFKALPNLNPDKSPSGHGSALSSTSAFRRELELFLHENNTRSLFDAPCGDFNWMKDVKLPDDCKYVGGDIVRSLIAKLQKRSKEGACEFIYFDLTVDTSPPRMSGCVGIVSNTFLTLISC
jgi:hypothetical protein